MLEGVNGNQLSNEELAATLSALVRNTGRMSFDTHVGDPLFSVYALMQKNLSAEGIPCTVKVKSGSTKYNFGSP